MEDLLVSVDSVDKGKALSSEVQKLARKGNFNLTQCASNHSDVLKDLKPPEKDSRVLGLEWLLESDHLEICRGVSFDSQQQWT